MAKKKKNRAAVSTVSSAAVPSSAAGAELGSAVKAVQWLASGQGKSDGGVEWCGMIGLEESIYGNNDNDYDDITIMVILWY